MKTDAIRYSETLDYCDGVQLFAADDGAGRRYIAVLVATGAASDQYLVARCAGDQLRRFQSGGVDLKALLLQSAREGWYLADITDFGEPIALGRRRTAPIPDVFLPAAGFYLADTMQPVGQAVVPAAFPGA